MKKKKSLDFMPTVFSFISIFRNKHYEMFGTYFTCFEKCCI